MCHCWNGLQYNRTSWQSSTMDKESRAYVPQPKVISTYNKFIGGMDRHNWLVSKYSTSTRGLKKKVLAFVYSNNWHVYHKCIIIHTFVNKDKRDLINLLNFKREICSAYLKEHNEKLQGQRKRNIPRPTTVQDYIRFEWEVILWQEQQCEYKLCHAKLTIYCQKCDTTLCLKCSLLSTKIIT